MSTVLDAFLTRYGGTYPPPRAPVHAVDESSHPITSHFENDYVDLTDRKMSDTSKVRHDTPYHSSRQSSLRATLAIPGSRILETDETIDKPGIPFQYSDRQLADSPIGSNRAPDANDTLASVDMSDSFSTPGAELALGPQPLPFVLQRAASGINDTSPSKQPRAFYDYRLHNYSMPAVIVDLDEDKEEDLSDAGENIRSSKLTFANDDDTDAPALKLSTWRTEQIKYTKRARRGQDSTPKPIPALHGPLSLPYARNPRSVLCDLFHHS